MNLKIEDIKKFFSNINYSHFGNKKMFKDQVNYLKDELKRTDDLLVRNILTHRNNLLILIGGLIAFLGIVHNRLSFDTNLYLKITTISFVITIFSSIIVAIIITIFDIKLIRYKYEVALKYYEDLVEFLSKVKTLKFGKSEKDKYDEIKNKFNKDIKTPLKYKIILRIGAFFTFFYSSGLIIGMISIMIYYYDLLFIK